MLGAAAAACTESAQSFTAQELRIIRSLSPLGPPPADSTNRIDGDAVAIELGESLFFDARLSADDQVSCATCHDPAKSWTDGLPVAVGAGTGTRNTPSLWNVAHNRWFSWDGRADSLWSQALKPIENGLEMNGSRLQTLHLVAGDAALQARYEDVFGPLPDVADAERFPRAGGPLANDGERQANWWTMDGADREIVDGVFANIGKAIAAFVATIETQPAPFDRFAADLRAGRLRSEAITASAQNGLRIFVGKGNCVLCHSGPNFTNKEFHDIRVPPLAAGAPRDPGRLGGASRLIEDEFIAAGPHSDDPSGSRAGQLAYLDVEAGLLGHFKTPSLRNVAMTAPYMHAGQFETLRDVVNHYSTLETAAEPADPAHVEVLIEPLRFSQPEIADLVSFLESLTSSAASRSADQ
jgi:cytochrome c peroxidase